jgi:hypothetical protein
MSWVITAIAVTATAGAVSARGQYVAGKTKRLSLNVRPKKKEWLLRVVNCNVEKN